MDLLTITKLVVKDGMNGFTTYQVGKRIPDVRKEVKCVRIENSIGGYTIRIENSIGGYTIVGENGDVYIDVKEEFVVKKVTITTKE